jgi:thiol-disulfide isomerase/thioredoxin
MKAISIFMLSVAAAGMLACSGNEAKYVITGINAPQDGVSVYLVDRYIADDIDSAVVVDGTFKMKGKTTKDAFLGIVVEGSDWNYPLFNDGVPVQINFTDSSVTGSAQNVKLTECDKRNSKAYARLNQLIEDYLALPKEEREATEDEFIAEYETVYQDFADTKLAIIEENKDNLIPVAFIENIPEVAGYAKFNELVSMDAPFARHPFVVDLKEGLEEAMAQELEAEDVRSAVIGQRFLDLEEADTEGKMHKLSEYAGQGKWVLVDFWASWCSPCRAEMPNVVAAYKQYHDKGFEIVGLSFDSEKDSWEKAIVEWQMPWIHLSDLKSWKTVAAEVYSVNAIPDNLLIDPEGIVVARGLRGEALAKKLAEAFN